MVLHDGETFINKEAPAMLQGLDEQIKVIFFFIHRRRFLNLQMFPIMNYLQFPDSLRIWSTL